MEPSAGLTVCLVLSSVWHHRTKSRDQLHGEKGNDTSRWPHGCADLRAGQHSAGPAVPSFTGTESGSYTHNKSVFMPVDKTELIIKVP